MLSIQRTNIQSREPVLKCIRCVLKNIKGITFHLILYPLERFMNTLHISKLTKCAERCTRKNVIIEWNSFLHNKYYWHVLRAFCFSNFFTSIVHKIVCKCFMVFLKSSSYQSICIIHFCGSDRRIRIEKVCIKLLCCFKSMFSIMYDI